GRASEQTRPFRRAAGAGPLWRRRRSLPNSAGPSSKQREGVAVSDLRGRAKTSVETTAETTANDAVMIDECERIVRDDGFELIFGRAGADDVRRSRLGRNVIDPVSAQRVIVDREFARRPLDRPTGGKKPLDPHALEVIASLTAPCPGTLPSRHWLSPRPRLIKKRHGRRVSIRICSSKISLPQRKITAR